MKLIGTIAFLVLISVGCQKEDIRPTHACPHTNELRSSGDPVIDDVVTDTDESTGNGITDLGNGTATFNPAIATISHPITYTYTNPITTCSNSKTYNVTIKPKPTLYTVTGGGTYCINNNTNHVGLDGSDNLTVYQLKLNGSNIATATGTGAPIDFGLKTASGIYTVVATNPAPNSCKLSFTFIITDIKLL